MGFALDPKKDFSQYMMDTWGLEEGLPHMSVYTILRTREGYLWVGTGEGLVRFDGVRFEIFDKRRVKEMSSNRVWALCEDRDGNLWIGTEGGLVRLQDGKFTTYTIQQGLVYNDIRALHEDRKGNLWIATFGGGLSRLKDDGFITYTTKQGLAHDYVNSIHEDRKGSLWIATSGGLSRLQEGQFTTYTTEQGLVHDIVRVIHIDRNGSLWIGTDYGLGHMQGGRFTTYTTKQGLAHDFVYAIHEDRNGILWVGTEGGGLSRLQDGRFTTYTTQQGLAHDIVSTIHEDRAGSLWIGTEGGGLSRLQDVQFTTYTTQQGLAHDIARAIHEDRNGTLWIGTEGGGLSRMQDGEFITFTTQQGLVHNTVRAIREDKTGSLWIGTIDGLSRLQDGRFTTFTAQQGLVKYRIAALHEDRNGNLWIGTEGGGLSRLKDDQFTTFTTQQGLVNNRVYAIHEDRNGSLWIGTKGGLSRLQDGQFTNYTTQQGLAHDIVTAIYEDRNGSLWIGTFGGGMSRLKAGKFISITYTDGLYDNIVYVIIDDGQGNFWMSCNKGIFRVSQNELNNFCGGIIKTVHCVSYNEKDGLKSRECNHGSPAGWKTRDGKLWFPTFKGIAMIDPNNIKTNPLPPPVIIEKIIVGEKTIEPPFSAKRQMLAFPPGKNEVKIEYTGLSLLVPKRVLFKTRLEGYEAQWKEMQQQRFVNYTNLSPGHYTFHVIACNNDGVWNETGASVSFFLEPWFYQTWWFVTLCGLLVVGLGFIGYSLRVRQLKDREKALSQLVEERTRDLKERNIELEKAKEEAEKEKEAAHKANKAKSEFLANMSHEIRTPMNAILGFTQIMAEEITDRQHKNYLEAVSSSGKTLLGLINDILDLSKVESGKMELQPEPINPRAVLNEIRFIFAGEVMEKELEFRLEVDPALPDTLLMDGLRIRQILINLTGNALKFTDTGFVKLEAAVSASDVGHGPVRTTTDKKSEKEGDVGELVNVTFSVQDTGIGIPKDQQERIFEAFEQQAGQSAKEYGGTGLGLAITRRLVEMMGGSLSVMSVPGSGSTFTITLNRVPVFGSSVRSGRHSGPEPDTIRFEPAILLVVDDNSLNRELLIRYLLHCPFEIIEAENGAKALELARQFPPDLVLMDSKMPVMNGMETTKRFREDPQLKDIPIIIVTASALKNQQDEIHQSGSDGFLNKPVTKNKLFSELIRFLPYSSVPGNNGSQFYMPVFLHYSVDTLEILHIFLTFLKEFRV